MVPEADGIIGGGDRFIAWYCPWGGPAVARARRTQSSLPCDCGPLARGPLCKLWGGEKGPGRFARLLEQMIPNFRTIQLGLWLNIDWSE